MIVVLLVFLSGAALLSAFQSAPQFTIPEQADYFTTDNLGNAYLVKGPVLRKFDAKGIFQKEFSNKNFGSISSADAGNPLRPVLFYRDFNRVIFLDNTLSQNGDAVQLDALGFPLTTLAASSHDNGLWIYDQQNFELIRFNRNLQIEQRTGNLSQVLGVDSLQPNFLLEKDNRLFLNNPSTGILVFDIFGTYSKTIGIKGLKQFQVSEDRIFWYAQDMQFVDIRTLEQGGRGNSENETIDQLMSQPDISVVRRENGRYYFLSPGKLVICGE